MYTLHKYVAANGTAMKRAFVAYSTQFLVTLHGGTPETFDFCNIIHNLASIAS